MGAPAVGSRLKPAERAGSPMEANNTRAIAATALAVCGLFAVVLVNEAYVGDGGGDGSSLEEGMSMPMPPSTHQPPLLIGTGGKGLTGISRCNKCRQSLEALCRSHGTYPKCVASKVVQQKRAHCEASGMQVVRGVLKCPGDEAQIPASVRCRKCRTDTETACRAHGGYPKCKSSPAKAVFRKCEQEAGLTNIKGVLVCPGDGKVPQQVSCTACRFNVVHICQRHGGFPSCQTQLAVKTAVEACGQFGMRRLAETKALTCPMEKTGVLSTVRSECDMCRNHLQGECHKYGGYPKCLTKGVLKTSLQLCVKKRGLKMIGGRLFCKGDKLIKKPISTPKHFRLPTAVIKKAAHHKHKTVKPPKSLTCAICAAHLKASCSKLGGFPRCKRVQQVKQIYHSCRKFLRMKSTKRGFACPKKNSHKKAKKAGALACGLLCRKKKAKKAKKHSHKKAKKASALACGLLCRKKKAKAAKKHSHKKNSFKAADTNGSHFLNKKEWNKAKHVKSHKKKHSHKAKKKAKKKHSHKKAKKKAKKHSRKAKKHSHKKAKKKAKKHAKKHAKKAVKHAKKAAKHKKAAVMHNKKAATHAAKAHKHAKKAAKLKKKAAKAAAAGHHAKAAKLNKKAAKHAAKAHKHAAKAHKHAAKAHKHAAKAHKHAAKAHKHAAKAHKHAAKAHQHAAHKHAAKAAKLKKKAAKAAAAGHHAKAAKLNKKAAKHKKKAAKHKKKAKRHKKKAKRHKKKAVKHAKKAAKHAKKAKKAAKKAKHGHGHKKAAKKTAKKAKKKVAKNHSNHKASVILSTADNVVDQVDADRREIEKFIADESPTAPNTDLVQDEFLAFKRDMEAEEDIQDWS